MNKKLEVNVTLSDEHEHEDDKSNNVINSPSIMHTPSLLFQNSPKIKDKRDKLEELIIKVSKDNKNNIVLSEIPCFTNKIDDSKPISDSKTDFQSEDQSSKFEALFLKVPDEDKNKVVKASSEIEKTESPKMDNKNPQDIWVFNMGGQQQGVYGGAQQGYGGQPQPGYGSPQQGGYVSPPGGYYGPPQGGYSGQPQSGFFGPQQAGYGGPQQIGYGGPQQGGYGYGGPQGGYDTGEGLDYDPKTRNPFIKLVFSILCVMLILTAAFILAVITVEELNAFYRASGLLYLLVSAGLLMGGNFLMVCCNFTRTPPCNYICLFIIVILMSNFAACVTSKYKTDILFYAFVATAVTVFVCMLLACSSFDFTKWYLYVVAISVVLSVVSLMSAIATLAFGIYYKPFRILLIFLFSILNVVMLIIELQMVLGGRSIELGEDDYALAAYMLYCSILEMFLNFVRMLGLLDD